MLVNPKMKPESTLSKTITWGILLTKVTSHYTVLLLQGLGSDIRLPAPSKGPSHLTIST